MSNDQLFRPATLFLVGSLCVCALVCPRPASADPSDILTLTLSGIVACNPGATCPSATGTVTGTFHIDFDTETIVGPWSFSTPYGTISSSGSSAFSEGFAVSGVSGEEDGWGFCGSVSGSTCSDGLVLVLPELDPSEGGPLVVSHLDSSRVSALSATIKLNGTGSTGEMDFTSGAVTQAGDPTPEPSSFILLGTGLLGLGPVLRRRLLRV